MNKLYNEQDIQNIATAIRTKNSSAPAAMKVREMDQAILDIPTHGLDFTIEPEPPWTRPEEWPDLDALWEYDPDTRGEAWLTYIKTEGVHWGYGLSVSHATIDSGYLDSSGNYVIINSTTVTSGSATSAYYEFPDDKDIILVRLTVDKPSNWLSYFCFSTILSSNTGLPYDFNAQENCCYEIVGCLPYVTPAVSGVARSMITIYMEHFKLSFGISRACTGANLNALFENAHSLRKIDFDNFDTSDWTVTSCNGTFNRCIMLQELDFTGLDTHNWSINSCQNLFNRCYNLRKINFGNIDTSNWFQTKGRCDSMFYYCLLLEELDFSFAETTGSNVSNISSCFMWCLNLKKINFGNIDTSNWSLDYSTSTLNNIFYGCRSLKELDLSKIDTSGIPEGSYNAIGGTFALCNSLEKIIFGPKLTLSQIKLTSSASLFEQCYSLKELDMSNVELHFSAQSGSTTNAYTSNWFVDAPNLINLKMPKIIIEAPSTAGLLGYVFRYGTRLNVLDFSDIDNELNPDFRYDAIGYSPYLEEFHFPTTLGNNSGGTWFQFCFNLKEVYPPENGWPTVNIGFIDSSTTGSSKLSKESVHRIIQALPNVTKATTLNLASAKNKLTAEDIAIAVEKGWTIA